MGDLHKNMPEDDYHSLDAVGSTLIRAADQSMDAYLHERGSERDPSSAMQLGSWIHQAVLEPERFEEIKNAIPPERPGKRSWQDKHLQTYYLRVNPDPATETLETCTDECGDLFHDYECVAARKTETGKSAKKCQEYLQEHGGTELIDYYRQDGIEYPMDIDVPSRDQLERIEMARDAVLEHPKVTGGLLDGDREVSFTWTERPRDLEIECKGRADVVSQISDDEVIIGDLKTTSRSVSPGSYARTVGRRKYHMQAAWYSRGFEIASELDVAAFLFIAVQTKPPYHVQIMRLDSDSIEAGLMRCMDALTTLSRYREGALEYTGLDPDIAEISLKEWEK